MDDRKNHQLNKGSGFRMADLDAIMRKPVEIENDKIVAKRKKEVRVISYKLSCN